MNLDSTITQVNFNNEWITPKQLENELGITIRQQEKLRMKRKDIDNAIKPIPYSKIGRNVIYNRAKINEWLLDNQVKNQ